MTNLIYSLQNPNSLEVSVREIAASLIDNAIEIIEDPAVDEHTTVHEVRKRCKELRGLLRLLRGPLEKNGIYKRENEWFRDSARKLSVIRDAEALTETYDMLMKHFADEIDRRSFSWIRRRLTIRKKELVANAGVTERIEQFHARMKFARGRLDDWVNAAESFDDLRCGFKKPYRRGILAMAAAYEKPDSERFHEWRKRVKYHRYHCELLCPIWPAVVSARQSEVHILSEFLGKEHDLNVFHETLTAEVARFGEGREIPVSLALAEQLRDELREQSRCIGGRIFCEKPKHLAQRFDDWFTIWQSER